MCHFPPRSGGIDFVQDPSSAHFSDDPLPKMVREVIQNSLDARQSGRDGDPIVVSFTDTEVERDLIGASQLYKHLTACRDRAKEYCHSSVIELYERARDTLKARRIRCLQIVDSTTTGLSGTKWLALVIQEGAVQKSSQGAPGGSYGIGKNAVFNVSDIQTVFYSTKYVDEHREGRVEKLQGKATLMSHPNPECASEDLQHIGFYMTADKKRLVTTDIPAFFRLEETGTGVFVMGFNPRSDDWTKDVQTAVIENFFHAIHHKQLKVHISSGDTVPPIEITHETIDHLFESSRSAIGSEAYHYYLAIRDEDAEPTADLDGVGVLLVQVRTGAGPRRTAYVNRNGMLITASRELNVNPIAPRGKSLWPDYAAVVTPTDDDGDKWIRAMENPSHDSISTGQLHEKDEIRDATRIFKQARAAIREIIDQKAEIEKYGDTSNLDELAAVFPDFDADIESNRRLHVRLIEHRVQQRDTHGSAENDAEARLSDESQEGGTNERDGSLRGDQRKETHEHGDDTGLQSKRREEDRARRAWLRAPRVIHVGEREAVLAFTSQRDEPDEIRLALTPAGEEHDAEGRIPIEEATAVDHSDNGVGLEDGFVTMKLRANERVLVRVKTSVPIDGLALKIG